MPARLLPPLLLALASGSALAQSAPAKPPTTPTTAAAATPAAAAAVPTGATATPGKAHICLAPSSVDVSSGTASAAMEAIRQTFTSFLSGPTLEVAPLTSRLESQARAEAKADNCPYLLLTTVKQEHKGGSGGGPSLFQRMASGAVQQGAYAAGGAVGSPVGGIAANAAGGAAGAATYYSGSTKAHDELTLTSRLEAADGSVLVNETDKKKADSDGEDLLTPLVEKASNAVAGAVAKSSKS